MAGLLYLLLLACFTITFRNDLHEQLLSTFLSRVGISNSDTQHQNGACKASVRSEEKMHK